MSAASVSSSSSADLNGTWRVDLPREGGVTLRTYFIFRQNGAVFDGTVIINDAVDLPMRQPRFEGEVGVFSVDWNTDYRVRCEGDRLRVNITHNKKHSEDAIAVRVPESATRPPATLPLPAFEPLPPNGLALTPPMGWNSWNHFGDCVDDRIIRENADALVSTGLAAAGYVYVNIDDAWAGGRDAHGHLVPNAKFPDMKALADYVHSRGLKIGLYSSPGPRTCGGYEGSYGHEEQDANTFAAWGIDLLKHDWCSAARVYGNTPESLRAAYLKMGRALAQSGRPIVYSICEYGYGDVWTWGAQVGGNLWRTTNDIRDTWESMSEIGFSQNPYARFAGPGHWNDPDMLEVGNGGMTLTEYRTHFSLWCLLAAPLFAGNDLRIMTADTLTILANREAIAVNQDPLGRQAQRVMSRDGVELWTKPLHDGGIAFGLFNRSETPRNARLTWNDLGLASPPATLRDLWTHCDIAVDPDGYSAEIPPHGVAFLKAGAALQAVRG